MTTTRLYDLVVKTGEYQDRNGQTKARYENIGAVMRNENGQFAMLKKTFNPAGVPSDRDTIMVSMFEPKANRRQDNGYKANDSGYGGGGQPSSCDLDDEIPFAACKLI